MALQIEKATDVQREFFRGLREKQRNPGEVMGQANVFSEKKLNLPAGSGIITKKDYPKE